MKKKLLLGLMVAGVVLAFTSNVMACSKDKSKCTKCAIKAKQCKITKLKKKVKMLWVHKDALEISDKQIDKIKDIKHAALKELIQFKADKDIIMVDLKTEMWEEQIDLDAANKLIGAKYKVKEKTALTFVKAISDIQGVLTADQRAQWKEMKIAAKLYGDGCSKCAASDGKICPLTGKGSSKGSMK